MKHRRIVGGKSDERSLCNQPGKRMVRESRVCLARLLCKSACAQIARRTIFEHDVPSRQRFSERRIVHHGDTMAHSLGAEDLDRFAHRLGSADFTGMANDTQSFAPRQIKSRAKVHCGECKFVAAHSESDHAGAMQFGGSSAPLPWRPPDRTGAQRPQSSQCEGA